MIRTLGHDARLPSLGSIVLASQGGGQRKQLSYVGQGLQKRCFCSLPCDTSVLDLWTSQLWGKQPLCLALVFISPSPRVCP